MSRWVGLLQRRRGLVFAVPAGALAVLVIVAALNFDQGTPPSKREGRIKDAQALLAPRVATAEELANASGSLSEQTAISLTEGAWVQVADETGRLAQQYSAARLEPQPGSRLRMTEPRARMFQRDGRVMTMSAQGGLVSVPKRALESGSLAGDVVIRLFKPVDGREVDVLRDAPSIVVHADEAEFDGVAGEVRCERAVRIETDAGSFAGEGLTLVLDASGDGIETLVVVSALVWVTINVPNWVAERPLSCAVVRLPRTVVDRAAVCVGSRVPKLAPVRPSNCVVVSVTRSAAEIARTCVVANEPR